MSMVLLEAASLGVPVICSDIPENREVMREDAIYFSSGNSEDLVERLEYALGHRQDMTQMGQRARSRVLVEYDWDMIAARYNELYQTCVRGASGHS
jgi:glycosyltransferase involved in cell wall biosynthesis